MFSSPRVRQLHQAATTTLHEQDVAPHSRWKSFKEPLGLILQIFQDLTDKDESFWHGAIEYFERVELPAGKTIFTRGDEATASGFFLVQEGMLRGEYDLPQGKFFESIVAGTTCGELPFFSETSRTSTVVAERDSIAWKLTNEKWEDMQKNRPEIAQELLRVGFKLTSERMSAITS